MPKVTGVFDAIDNLDLISAEDIAKWIKNPPQSVILENYIANRILYPQAIAVSTEDLELDLSLLREALKKDKSYFSLESRKVIIPDILISRIPNLAKLVWVFIDAYLLDLNEKTRPEIWTVIMRHDDIDETLGTIIAPHFKGRGAIEIKLEGSKQSIVAKQGGLMVIPCLKSHCKLEFKLSSGEILAQKMGSVEVFGGKLGIVIEGRIP